MSLKINNTRGCLRCCVGRNQYNGFIYLAGMSTDEIFLMQYYDPLKKFMHFESLLPFRYGSERLNRFLDGHCIDADTTTYL